MLSITKKKPSLKSPGGAIFSNVLGVVVGFYRNVSGSAYFGDHKDYI